MSEVFMNHALAKRVLEIRQRGEDARTMEILGISDLWDKAMAMDEDELITFALAALHKYPDLVFAAMAQDRAELLRKGRRTDVNND